MSGIRHADSFFTPFGALDIQWLRLYLTLSMMTRAGRHDMKMMPIAEPAAFADEAGAD